MEQLFKDTLPLPPEIDIPDLNHNPVEPVVKIFQYPPWYVPGTSAVLEGDS